jgi:hypothetical protein
LAITSVGLQGPRIDTSGVRGVCHQPTTEQASSQ